MRKLFEFFVLFALLFAGCEKFTGPMGPQGPAGMDGTENVEYRDYLVPAGLWQGTGDIKTATLAVYQINQEFLDAGGWVMVYQKFADGGFAALPRNFVISDKWLNLGYEYMAGEIVFFMIKESGVNWGTIGDLQFRVALVSSQPIPDLVKRKPGGWYAVRAPVK
jgi:hypothetical protein